MCDVKITTPPTPGFGRSLTVNADSTAILKANFKPGLPADSTGCNCQKRTCPRRIHAVTGLVLGAGMVVHFAINALGVWPVRYQRAVDYLHRLGPLLPWTSALLVFVPLLMHAGMGINFLRKSGFKYGLPGHHHGSDTRYWLQRVSAVILAGFLLFHIISLAPFGLGMFKPEAAFDSTANAVGLFWGHFPSEHPGNLLISQFYLLGIAAAVFHLSNGVATGAEVLGFTRSPNAHARLWRICVVGGMALMGIGLAAWSVFAIRS